MNTVSFSLDKKIISLYRVYNEIYPGNIGLPDIAHDELLKFDFDALSYQVQPALRKAENKDGYSDINLPANPNLPSSTFLSFLLDAKDENAFAHNGIERVPFSSEITKAWFALYRNRELSKFEEQVCESMTALCNFAYDCNEMELRIDQSSEKLPYMGSLYNFIRGLEAENGIRHYHLAPVHLVIMLLSNKRKAVKFFLEVGNFWRRMGFEDIYKTRMFFEHRCFRQAFRMHLFG